MAGLFRSTRDVWTKEFEGEWLTSSLDKNLHRLKAVH